MVIPKALPRKSALPGQAVVIIGCDGRERVRGNWSGPRIFAEFTGFFAIEGLQFPFQSI